MIFSTLAPLLLLPVVAADVHRLKLKKIPRSLDQSHHGETAYLAEKYGAQSTGQFQQSPLMGTGGSGRNLKNGKPCKHADDLFWTQEMKKNGGHGVPLTST